MSTIIPRLYQTDKQALDAVSALKKKGGFRDSEISLVTASGGDLAASIGKHGVPSSHAKIYADHVSRGAALVLVRAPVLSTQRATKILRSFGPIDTGIAETDIYTQADIGGVPRIIRSRPRTVLLDSDKPITSSFGFPTIIKDAKPFSKVTADSKPVTNLAHGTTSSWIGIPTVIPDRHR